MNPPQSGAVTHHHDQLITPQSLSVMKTMASWPKKPMPLDELLLLLMCFLWLKNVSGFRVEGGLGEGGDDLTGEGTLQRAAGDSPLANIVLRYLFGQP